MEKTKLMDDWAIAGSDYAEFETAIKEIAEKTKVKTVRGMEVVFLSLCPLPECQKDGRLAFYNLSEEYLTGYKARGEKLHICTVPIERLAPELVDELVANKELMVLLGNEIYFLSDMAHPTLTMRSGVAGNSTVNIANIFRDMHIADATFMRNEKINFVYREEEVDGRTMRKIFACLGQQYKEVPQTVLTKIVNLFKEEGLVGKVETNNWSMDHSFTRLFLDFPSIAEDFNRIYKLPEMMTPGLCLQTSDTGDSSVTIRGIYRTGSHYVVTDEVSHKHTKSIDVEKLVEAVGEQIFANFRKLPEALFNLIGKPITRSEWVLTNPADAEKNKDAVAAVLKTTIRKVVEPVLYKTHTASLLEKLVAEINPSAFYTMYDIAMLFMGLADRIVGASEVQVEAVRKACAKVPFILEKEKAVVEIGDLELLPA